MMSIRRLWRKKKHVRFTMTVLSEMAFLTRSLIPWVTSDMIFYGNVYEQENILLLHIESIHFYTAKVSPDRD